MCDCCEHRKRILKNNYEESFISKGPFGYSIILDDKVKHLCFNVGMIFYCPICGKKLKGDKNE